MYPSITYRIRTGCGNAFLTILFNKDKKDIFKFLIHMGKSATCASVHAHNYNNMNLPKNKDERLKYYSEMTGLYCSQTKCCISLIGHKLMDIELGLI